MKKMKLLQTIHKAPILVERMEGRKKKKRESWDVLGGDE